MDPRPGSGDCEAFVGTWGQPVLAVSSLAYAAAGVFLLVWGWRRADVPRGWLALFAAGLVLTGLGSADYHGPALGPEPLLHDGGLALALIVALGIDLSRLAVPPRRIGLWLGALVVAGAIVLIAAPAASPALAGIAAVGLVVAEVMVYRRGLRAPGPYLYAAVAVLVVGAIVFALSRTGGPLCDPESPIQGHALWHLMTALALALWGMASLPLGTTPPGATDHESVIPERPRP